MRSTLLLTVVDCRHAGQWSTAEEHEASHAGAVGRVTSIDATKPYTQYQASGKQASHLEGDGGGSPKTLAQSCLTTRDSLGDEVGVDLHKESIFPISMQMGTLNPRQTA